jgi:hypothetical protein
MTTTAAQLWLGAAAFELVGLVLVAAVRPDPKRIAALMRSESVSSTRTGAPIGELLRQPGVVPALLAAQASLWVIVSVLTLIGTASRPTRGRRRGPSSSLVRSQLLDQAPKGREGEALLRGEGEWWRRHDEYEDN